MNIILTSQLNNERCFRYNIMPSSSKFDYYVGLLTAKGLKDIAVKLYLLTNI